MAGNNNNIPESLAGEEQRLYQEFLAQLRPEIEHFVADWERGCWHRVSGFGNRFYSGLFKAMTMIQRANHFTLKVQITTNAGVRDVTRLCYIHEPSMKRMLRDLKAQHSGNQPDEEAPIQVGYQARKDHARKLFSQRYPRWEFSYSLGERTHGFNAIIESMENDHSFQNYSPQPSLEALMRHSSIVDNPDLDDHTACDECDVEEVANTADDADAPSPVDPWHLSRTFHSWATCTAYGILRLCVFIESQGPMIYPCPSPPEPVTDFHRHSDLWVHMWADGSYSAIIPRHETPVGSPRDGCAPGPSGGGGPGGDGNDGGEGGNGPAPSRRSMRRTKLQGQERAKDKDGGRRKQKGKLTNRPSGIYTTKSMGLSYAGVTKRYGGLGVASNAASRHGSFMKNLNIIIAEAYERMTAPASMATVAGTEDGSDLGDERRISCAAAVSMTVA